MATKKGSPHISMCTGGPGVGSRPQMVSWWIEVQIWCKGSLEVKMYSYESAGFEIQGISRPFVYTLTQVQ